MSSDIAFQFAIPPELTLEHHFQFERSTIRPGNLEDEVRARLAALDFHSLAVSDALNAFNTTLATAVRNLSSQESRFYLQFGALRRTTILLSSFERLISRIPPDRDTPLTQDETNTATLDVNAIYINIQGALDNFAWGLLFENDETRASALYANKKQRKKVGLFNSTIAQVLTTEQRSALDGYKAWGIDLGNKRHPSAHRIPLSIPPAILTPEEEKTRSDYFEEFWALSGAGALDEAQASLDKMDTVGSFTPFFMHHPNEALIPIYPTIPDDLAHLIAIGRIAVDRLRPSNF